MLDFGWAELLIIVAVAVFVIGPKDIPHIMYGIGRLLRRVQYIKYAVGQQFDDIMNTGDLEELRKGVNFEAPRSKDDIIPEKSEDGEEDDPMLLEDNKIYTKIASQYNQTFITPSDYLDEFLSDLDKNTSILDMGCGTGVDANFMVERGCNVEGIDLSQDMLSFATKKYPNIKFTHADFLVFDAQSSRYGAIISAYSIIHFEKQELESVFTKFFSTLEDSGRLFLSFHGGVSEEKEEIEPFNPDYSFFLNILSISEVTELLEKVGFKITKVIERPTEIAEEMPYDKVTIFAEKS